MVPFFNARQVEQAVSPERAVEAVREAAKRGSFRGLGLTTRVPAPTRHRDGKSQVRDF